jgi:hypothetical protein
VARSRTTTKDLEDKLREILVRDCRNQYIFVGFDKDAEPIIGNYVLEEVDNVKRTITIERFATAEQMGKSLGNIMLKDKYRRLEVYPRKMSDAQLSEMYRALSVKLRSSRT